MEIINFEKSIRAKVRKSKIRLNIIKIKISIVERNTWSCVRLCQVFRYQLIIVKYAVCLITHDRYILEPLKLVKKSDHYSNCKLKRIKRAGGV